MRVVVVACAAVCDVAVRRRAVACAVVAVRRRAVLVWVLLLLLLCGLSHQTSP